MDDIQLNIDEPRRFSEQKVKVTVKKNGQTRTFWQYLFDLSVKTFLCALLLALDFSLFANAGSYHLFSSAARLTPEAEWIYLGIAAVSFVIMLAASFSKSVENTVLSAVFALFVIALINQFAVFEKHSGLLILFSGLFSDKVNAILYEYAFLIIGAASFVVFFTLLKLLKRQTLLYVTLGIAAVLGWILSEAYLNPSSQYFKTIVSSGEKQSQEEGENLIFLSFNGLSSPNILKNIAKESKTPLITESLNNALGFFNQNNFTLYPNAMAKSTDAFQNLIASYNPQSEKNPSELILASTIKDSYFDFSTLQFEKSYLKENALYAFLKENGYNINVYQTRELDTCYVNSKLEASLCKEKVNTPINLSTDNLSTTQKSLFLTAQWLQSTGFVSSINPLLKGISYIATNKELRPLNVDPNQLYAINAFKVFDQIAEQIDAQTGNQAYFAVIDLPSDTYVYDSFCRQKNVDEWISGADVPFVQTALDKKRTAYAEQVNCLYGALEKFMQQLQKSGSLDNTTLVIEGLNVPQKLNRIEQDAYRQMQNKYQITLAVRSPETSQSSIDTSVCYVTDILASYLITHEPCQEFAPIRTTEENLEKIKTFVRSDNWTPEDLAQAKISFGEWFNGWAAHNDFESTLKVEKPLEKAEDGSQIIAEVKTLENVVEDEPEEKMESIAVAIEQNENQAEQVPAETPQEPKEIKENQIVEETSEKPAEVIPETLFDVGEVPQETRVEAQKVEESAEPEPQKEPDAIEEKVPETTEVIERAKQALADKESQKEAAQKAVEQKQDELNQLAETKADDKLRDILEAPAAAEKKLSPEQLKEQLRQDMSKAPNERKKVNIEIKVLDGKPNL